jgi:hypothetical protein
MPRRASARRVAVVVCRHYDICDQSGSLTSTSEPALLKTGVIGRPMHPREQRQRILDDYQRGGMIGRSSQRYATWKYQTFANWVQCRKRHISFYFFSTTFFAGS